jgi:hypothetical protein
MIRRELKSQLIELEKRYAAAVHAKRDENNAPARWARSHAIEVAAVVSYGEPKTEEAQRPLAGSAATLRRDRAPFSPDLSSRNRSNLARH